MIFFSLSDSSVSSENLVFSRDGCREGEGLHVSKEKGGYIEGGMKKDRGVILLSAL